MSRANINKWTLKTVGRFSVIFLAVEIVHRRSNVHQYFDLNEAVGEDECVLIGVVFFVNGIKAGFSIDSLNVRDDLDEFVMERA